MEEIRMKIVVKLYEFQNYFTVDCMPLEICKIARLGRSKICKEVDCAFTNKGFRASQNIYFYGYKLHLVYFILCVCQSFDLSLALVHDINYLLDTK